MANPDETTTRDLAYQLWERDGRPDGKDDDYWHAAEKLLADESDAETETAPVAEQVIPAAILARK